MSFASNATSVNQTKPSAAESAAQALAQGLAGKILMNSNLPPIAQEAAHMVLQVGQETLGSAMKQAFSNSNISQNSTAPSASDVDIRQPKAAASDESAPPPPAPAAIQQRVLAMNAAETQVEYEIVGSAETIDCAVCEQTGIGFLFEPENFELDALMGIPADVLPSSKDVLPHVDLDAPMTEQGMLDALARLYPEEAWQLLYILGPEGAGGGMGFRISLMNAQETYDAIQREKQTLYDGYHEGMKEVSDLTTLFGMAISRNRRLAWMTDRQENQLNDWWFDEKDRTLNISTWAEGEVFGDIWQDRALTNKAAAEKLRNLIAQTFNGEETFWQTTGRIAMGTGLVVFGYVDIVAGVSLATGGTAATFGVGAVVTITAGVALTVIGADQIAQGTMMLVSPDPEDHYGPIGALIHHLGESSGGSEGAKTADMAWTVTQILVSLGGSFAAVKLARSSAKGVLATGEVFPTIANAPRNLEYHAFKITDFPMNHVGQTADILPSLAGRGQVFDLGDGAKFIVKNTDDAQEETLRSLLRMRTLDNMAAAVKKAARRLNMLGAGRMRPSQIRAISREAGEYGANVERLSPRQFAERIRAGGGDPADTAAAFDPRTGSLILRQDASYYEAFHELQHARQWSELGAGPYNALSRFERENYVFQKIMGNSGEFSSTQLGHAGNYISKVGYEYGISNFKFPSSFTSSMLDDFIGFANPRITPGRTSYIGGLF